MSSDNAVTIVGNITRAPELRFLSSGVAIATFGIAVNRRKKKGDDWEEETSFFDCTAWQTLAENVAESLNKGDRVIVTGRLEQRTWETDAGDKRSKVEIVADEVGPSLRWATAAVTRNEKGSALPGRRPAPAAQAPADYDDESPF